MTVTLAPVFHYSTEPKIEEQKEVETETERNNLEMEKKTERRNPKRRKD